MQRAIRSFPEQFASPDSADERFAFLVSGGVDEVKAAAVRHAGWQGTALLPLSALSIVWAAVVYGALVGLAGLLAAAIGMAIFALAQGSLRRQFKAGKAIDAAHAASCFGTRELLTSFRFAVRYFSYLLTISRAATLVALQRLFVGLAGLAHLALSKRLLPIPFCPR